MDPVIKKDGKKKKRTLAMQKWRKRHYIIVIINTSAQLRLDAGNHYIWDRFREKGPNA